MMLVFPPAGKMVQDRCDAVDINLGCPQGIARSGHYGSFLLEEPELLERIVSHLHEHLSVTHSPTPLGAQHSLIPNSPQVPVTAKIRLLPSLADTISLAKRLEAAGLSMLTVHGRLKEQNKQYVGTCDWEAVKAIKEALQIPVVLNGGIGHMGDVERCLRETGVDGVMSSEAILENPALFAANTDPESHQYVDQNALAKEYLEQCDKYGAPGQGSGIKCVRAHMFKFLMHGLKGQEDLRKRLAEAKTLIEIKAVVEELTQRGWEQPYHHADAHPKLGKEYAPERSWYSRYRTHNLDGMAAPVSKRLAEAELKRAGGNKIAKTETVPKPATCTVCGAGFPSRSKMFKHIKANHPETIQVPAAVEAKD